MFQPRVLEYDLHDVAAPALVRESQQLLTGNYAASCPRSMQWMWSVRVIYPNMAAAVVNSSSFVLLEPGGRHLSMT